MAGENSAIWQVQSGAANGTEATAGASNTVLFNPSPILTTGQNIFQTEFTIRNSVPENESVASNNNEVQDMGLDGVDVQITGHLFRAKDQGVTGVTEDVQKLIKWMRDAKTTTGYEEGRFGLRLDDFPHFNIVPDGNGVAGNNTFGYVLADIRFIRESDEVDKVGFIATLRLAGDLDTALTPP